MRNRIADAIAKVGGRVTLIGGDSPAWVIGSIQPDTSINASISSPAGYGERDQYVLYIGDSLEARKIVKGMQLEYREQLFLVTSYKDYSLGNIPLYRRARLILLNKERG